MRRLNKASFVLLYFALFACVVFSCLQCLFFSFVFCPVFSSVYQHEWHYDSLIVLMCR